MATHVMPCHGAAMSSANVSNLWFRNRHAVILEALDAPLEILPPFVLCAEPGAGKSCLLDLLVNHWSNKGRPVFRDYFSGMESSKVINRVYAISRHLHAEGLAGALVALDDMPAMDEADAMRASKALGKLCNDGHRVVVSICPEASALLEQIPGACVYSTEYFSLEPDEVDLLLDDSIQHAPEEAYRLTGGIAALLDDARVRFSNLREGKETDSLACSAGLRSMVVNSLRRTLMTEERSIRYSMMLLGTGDVSDVACAVGRDATELVDSMGLRAPFFGIDSGSDTFECIRLGDKSGFAACIADLVPLSCEFRDVSLRCAQILLHRGDFARAGLVLSRLCNPSDAERLALVCPLELINAGEHRLVRQAAASEVSLEGEMEFYKAASEVFVAWADCSRDQLLSSFARLPEPAGIRQSEMFGQAVAVLLSAQLEVCSLASPSGVGRYMQDIERSGWANTANKSGAVGQMGDPSLLGGRRDDICCQGSFPSPGHVERLLDQWDGSGNDLLESLAMHVRVRQCLLSGEYSNALKRLLLSGIRRDGTDLLSSIIATDYFIASALAGDADSRGGESLARSTSFYLFAGMTERSVRQVIERRVLAILCGDAEKPGELDATLSRASRNGEDATESIVLLARSMSDLRCGSYLHAHVRAANAVTRASAAGLSHVATQARLIECAADACLGGREAIELWATWPSEDLTPVCAWLANAVDAEEVSKVNRRDSVRKRNESDIPVLSLLTQFCGDLSDRLWSRLPKGCRAAVTEFRKATSDLYGVDLSRGIDGATDQVDARLHIRLMGGFEVSRDGVPIPHAAWKRRKARVLLGLLAVIEGHEITRAAAVSALWSDCDYVTGRDRLYVTLGALRKAIGQTADGPQYVEGVDGRLRLNPDCVTVDLDEFAKACDEALAVLGNDEALVARCVDIRDQYVGDVTEMSESTGSFVARGEEERRRFTNVMSVGAQACMRMGSYVQAEWFANAAYRVDPLREDVAELEIRALFAQGRGVEARAEYERYAKRLIEMTGMPPSIALRRMVSELSEGLPGKMADPEEAECVEGETEVQTGY